MKILLTGGTGFLGKQLIREFLNLRHQVILVKRRSTDMRSIEQRFGALQAWNMEDQLEQVFREHTDIDVVIHAATEYGREPALPTSTFETNLAMPVHLLELAIRHKVPLFLNTDTFFNSDQANYSFFGSYVLSKRHFQEWGKHSADQGAIHFINLRLFHLYGPDDGKKKFVRSMVERCLNGEEIDLTSGTQKRDFIHIQDAVTALVKVMNHEFSQRHIAAHYKHYDIGTGISISIRDFVERINAQCGNHALIHFGALPMRDGEFIDSRADVGPLQTLEWSPRISLEQGITTVIDDIQSPSS